MNKKYEVRLSEADQAYIQQRLNEPSTPAGLRKRGLILLLADENQGLIPTQAEIAKRCQVSEGQVGQTLKNYSLFGLQSTLTYRKRSDPPRPSIVTGEAEARIVALACGEPPTGFAKWTVRLLKKRVVELEILPEVGRETIRKTLKKHNLSLT